MVRGRLTKKHASPRPPRLLPEYWNALSKKGKRDAIAAWEAEKARHKEVEALK